MEDPYRLGLLNLLLGRNDQLINNFEAHLLLANLGNIDWRPLINLWSVLEYLTKYSAKSAKPTKHLTTLFDEVLSDPASFFDGVDDSNIEAKTAELEAVVAELAQVNDARFGQQIPWVWALWRLSLDLGAGDHRAEVRATSTTGTIQPSTDTTSSDGNSQIRDIRFTVS